MRNIFFAGTLWVCSGLVGCSAPTSDPEPETSDTRSNAVESVVETLEVAATPEAHYEIYCALCHGDDREGYKNDDAPSLKTETLFAASPIVPYMATAYGRPGTPMGPYLTDLGGPLTEAQIQELAIWLNVQAGYSVTPPYEMDIAPVEGDIDLGREVYQQHCATCHGVEGEGGTGTALGNITMLATSPDSFLKAAIAKGRDGTEMVAFDGTLSEAEIDNVVAFLRSRAQGWDADALTFDTPPALDNIVINPDGPDPEFELSDGRYVSATDLNAELEAGAKVILIDTRVPYFWAMAHIRGSLPVPYYSSREEIFAALPNDDTWIVAYCECPRAAADTAVDALRELGYANTAVLYEGYAGWAAQGFPIAVGNVNQDK